MKETKQDWEENDQGVLRILQSLREVVAENISKTQISHTKTDSTIDRSNDNTQNI